MRKFSKNSKQSIPKQKQYIYIYIYIVSKSKQIFCSKKKSKQISYIKNFLLRENKKEDFCIIFFLRIRFLHYNYVLVIKLWLFVYLGSNLKGGTLIFVYFCVVIKGPSRCLVRWLYNWVLLSIIYFPSL